MRDAPYQKGGIKIDRVYEVFEWHGEGRKWKDKDGYWWGGYTKEMGVRQLRQYSPPFPSTACQQCGMYNHATERCKVRGDKRMPKCGCCEQWYYDRECPLGAALRRDAVERKKQVAILRRRERLTAREFESVEEEDVIRLGIDVDRWPSWTRKACYGKDRAPAAGPSNHRHIHNNDGAHTRPNE